MGDFGDYRSPLRLEDGSAVVTADDWERRRADIIDTWHGLMGPWPEMIERPQIDYLDQVRRGDLTQHRVRLEHFLKGKTSASNPSRSSDGIEHANPTESIPTEPLKR